SLRRPSGPGIENVAIAGAVDLDEAFIVAAGRQRAVVQGDLRHQRGGIARMANADPPGLTVGLRTDHADVTAEIDEAMPRSQIAIDLRGTIGRVFLAEAAEVELHAG